MAYRTSHQRETQLSETSRRLGPLRKVERHLGPDDRLVCGHTVPAWGLVAQRRRCSKCRDGVA
jgi:hypothetical protein